MDYQAVLYDPIYNTHGVEASLDFATGESATLTVLDKTSGIETGDGVQVSTILPAAAVRVAELISLGLTVKRLSESGTKITFNGFTWDVDTYRLKPSPNGENDGEALLILSSRQEALGMKPGTYDFVMVRGSNAPLVLQLVTVDANEVETPIPFDDVRLSVYSGDTLLFRKSLGNGIEITDSGASEITWIPTIAESRLIPLGPVAKYELEVRDGSGQNVILMGTITGMGGLNDDA